MQRKMKKLEMAAVATAALLFGAFGVGQASVAQEARIAKDTGPASASCDALSKGSAPWMRCVGAATASMSDAELFYAGYWLAKNGQYGEALAYLDLVRQKDERALTYIGFATRKLGDVEAALPYYAKALQMNPGYSVARAYLGEAFLTKNEPEKARGELAQIAERCGATCAEYASLADAIARYESAHKS